MREYYRSMAGVLVAVLLSGLSASLVSGDSISSHYTLTGPTETITMSFDSPSTPTLQTYTGPVEIVVSGVGSSWPLDYNYPADAFYNLPEGSWTPSNEANYPYYGLNLGWDSFALDPSHPGIHNIFNYIGFIQDVGAVSPGVGAIPTYATNHIYDFVINVPLSAGHLAFAISDGAYGDNTGAFNIQVTQLSQNVTPVPLPASCWQGLAVLGAIGLYSLCKKFKEAQLSSH